MQIIKKMKHVNAGLNINGKKIKNVILSISG